MSSSLCATCGEALGSSKVITFSDITHHADCFGCHSCGAPLAANCVAIATRPYCTKCAKAALVQLRQKAVRLKAERAKREAAGDGAAGREEKRRVQSAALSSERKKVLNKARADGDAAEKKRAALEAAKARRDALLKKRDQIAAAKKRKDALLQQKKQQQQQQQQQQQTESKSRPTSNQYELLPQKVREDVDDSAAKQLLAKKKALLEKRKAMEEKRKMLESRKSQIQQRLSTVQQSGSSAPPASETDEQRRKRVAAEREKLVAAAKERRAAKLAEKKAEVQRKKAQLEKAKQEKLRLAAEREKAAREKAEAQKAEAARAKAEAERAAKEAAEKAALEKAEAERAAAERAAAEKRKREAAERRRKRDEMLKRQREEEERAAREEQELHRKMNERKAREEERRLAFEAAERERREKEERVAEERRLAEEERERAHQAEQERRRLAVERAEQARKEKLREEEQRKRKAEQEAEAAMRAKLQAEEARAQKEAEAAARQRQEEEARALEAERKAQAELDALLSAEQDVDAMNEAELDALLGGKAEEEELLRKEEARLNAELQAAEEESKQFAKEQADADAELAALLGDMPSVTITGTTRSATDDLQPLDAMPSNVTSDTGTDELAALDAMLAAEDNAAKAEDNAANNAAQGSRQSEDVWAELADQTASDVQDLASGDKTMRDSEWAREMASLDELSNKDLFAMRQSELMNLTATTNPTNLPAQSSSQSTQSTQSTQYAHLPGDRRPDGNGSASAGGGGDAQYGHLPDRPVRPSDNNADNVPAPTHRAPRRGGKRGGSRGGRGGARRGRGGAVGATAGALTMPRRPKPEPVPRKSAPKADNDFAALDAILSESDMLEGLMFDEDEVENGGGGGGGGGGANQKTVEAVLDKLDDEDILALDVEEDEEERKLRLEVEELEREDAQYSARHAQESASRQQLRTMTAVDVNDVSTQVRDKSGVDEGEFNFDRDADSLAREAANKTTRDATSNANDAAFLDELLLSMDEDGECGEDALSRITDMLATPVETTTVAEAQQRKSAAVKSKAAEQTSRPAASVAVTEAFDTPKPSNMRGWLSKQAPSGMLKRWRKRFFVLKNDKMIYFEDDTVDAIVGVISLVNASVCATPQSKSPQFQINTPGRIYRLQAANDDRMERWIDQLRVACKFADALQLVRDNTAMSRVSVVRARALEGFMLRLVGSRWKEQYFVLSGGTLRAQASKTGDVIAQVPMYHAIIDRFDSNRPPKGFKSGVRGAENAFQVVGLKTTMVCKTYQTDDVANWIAALKEHKKSVEKTINAIQTER